MAYAKFPRDLKPSEGECVGIDIEGKPAVLVNLGGRLFAVGGICTHQYARLSEGFVDGEFIECPLHQGLFHIPTGKAQGGPVSVDLETFIVDESGGDIVVKSKVAE